MKTGRNEPCACGSGKKTKNCCGRNDAGMATNRRLGLIIGAIVVLAVVAVIASMREDSKRDPFSPFDASTPAPAPADAAATSTAVTDTPAAQPGPQPPGPAPAGKIWSPEHGHWHDKVETDSNVKIETTRIPASPAATAAAAPVNIPQPNVPTPPGKVWSPEHGHWHDVETGAAPVAEIPPDVEAQIKPPGVPSAPAGMVWSEEHKHWHKAEAVTATTATTAPATTTNPQ